MDAAHENVAGGETSQPPPLVPIHPESVDGDTGTLRWAIPATVLGIVGVPAGLPAVLQGLLDEGVLESVSVEPAAVRTTISTGCAWRDHGARVRAALQQSLNTPELWLPSETGSTADDLLRAAVVQVIEGEVGDYIRSHGGRVELLDVHDDEVEVELAGACAHCPASEFTLTSRIETGIRALYPGLRRVSANSQSEPNLAHRVLSWFPARAE